MNIDYATEVNFSSLIPPSWSTGSIYGRDPQRLFLADLKVLRLLAPKGYIFVQRVEYGRITGLRELENGKTNFLGVENGRMAGECLWLTKKKTRFRTSNAEWQICTRCELELWKVLSNPMLPNTWFHYKFWFISRIYSFESFLPPDISYSHVQCPGVFPVFRHPTSCFPIDEGYRTNIFINKDIVRSQVAMGEADLIVSSWPMLQSLAEFFYCQMPMGCKSLRGGTHAERGMVLKVLRECRGSWN